MVLWIALGIAQIAAYLAGIHLWLGVGTIGGLVIFFGTACLGPLGAIADAAISFYGALKGWHWAWWQALLLVAPFPILAVAATGLDGIVRLAETTVNAFARPKHG